MAEGKVVAESKITVAEAVAEILALVERLKLAFPGKTFTLDGRLLGDLGEVLVAGEYDVELFDKVKKIHDGKCSDGRLVQIKATMKDALTYPAKHDPDYYIGIRISETGTFDVVYNGPSAPIREAIKERAVPPNNLFSVKISRLKALSAKVAEKDRIPKRGAAKAIVPLG